jgi:molybdopterin-biosynthesis enzyme MoeA-like protein
LTGGDKIISKEIRLNLTESLVASDLEILQKEFADISMGSYPFVGGTALVFRGVDAERIDLASQKMTQIIKNLNGQIN